MFTVYCLLSTVYFSTPMSLPSGLPSYDFRRILVPSRDIPHYHHLRLVKDDAGLPALVRPEDPPPERLDIPAFFGAPGPIEIEIGCGKGTFATRYCEMHPDLPFLALEWEAEFACFTAERLARRPHLKHVRVVLGDAVPMFRDFLPANCANAVHIYFPDPWPKKRHRKHRIIRAEFLELLRRVLLPGGRFYFGTDHAEYNEEARALLAATPWLRMLDPDAPPTEGIETNFEVKYRKAGKPIYRCVLERMSE
jgi:tRNA (guanine-N7-)-methyltransferase